MCYFSGSFWNSLWCGRLPLSVHSVPFCSGYSHGRLPSFSICFLPGNRASYQPDSWRVHQQHLCQCWFFYTLSFGLFNSRLEISDVGCVFAWDTITSLLVVRKSDNFLVCVVFTSYFKGARGPCWRNIACEVVPFLRTARAKQ